MIGSSYYPEQENLLNPIGFEIENFPIEKHGKFFPLKSIERGCFLEIARKVINILTNGFLHVLGVIRGYPDSESTSGKKSNFRLKFD